MFRIPGRPDWRYLAFVLVLVFILYFRGASAVGLLGPDEPRYAQVAREMIRSGDYITPHLLGQPWFEKPPLYYWLTAVSFRLLGVSETTARLPAALAATGFLVLFAWLTRRLFPGETVRYAVLILASSAGWIGFARAATMEMLFAASLAGALGFLGLWLWQGRQVWLFAFHGLLAVSVLAKGLAGVALAGLILLVYGVLTRELRWLLRVLHPAPVLLFAVVALPWYAAMYFKHGEPFLQDFIIKHHFQRFVSSELAHPAPWWYYGPVLLAGLFPWTAHLALLRRAEKDNRRLFLLAWIAVVLLFFSFSQAKLPGYILPVLPALAMWIGDETKRASVGLLRATFVAQGLLLLLFSLAGKLPTALAWGISRVLPEVSLPALVLFEGAAVLLIWLAWRGRRLGATALACVIVAAGLVWVISAVAPAVDRTASARPIARTVCSRRFDLGDVRRHIRYGLEFYCDRPLEEPRAAPFVLSSTEVADAVPEMRFPEAGLTLWKRGR